MKKGFTIFLLTLFLLNVLGYYGIFLGLQFQNEKEMKALFDEDIYELGHEITIRIPLTLPYGTETHEYTRVDGEFEYNGEMYRMVKQRYLDGALQLVCVKDNQSKKIKQALSQIVKSFTDKPSTEKSSTKTIQTFIKDFMSTTTSLQSDVSGWNNSLIYISQERVYQSLAVELSSPPPKA